jgi:hypothetical protein
VTTAAANHERQPAVGIGNRRLRRRIEGRFKHSVMGSEAVCNDGRRSGTKAALYVPSFPICSRRAFGAHQRRRRSPIGVARHETLATNHAQYPLYPSASNGAARARSKLARPSARSLWSFIPFPPCYTRCGRRFAHASRAGECHPLGVVAQPVFEAGRQQHRWCVGRTRAVAGSRREHGYHDIRS